MNQEFSFSNSDLNRFAKLMEWEDGQTLESWSTRLLDALIPFVHGLHSTLYTQKEKDLYTLTASFAVPNLSTIPFEIKSGEEILGQAIKSKRVVEITDLNKLEYLDYGASVAIKPQAIICLPLTYNNNVVGVMEISSFYLFSERKKVFLEQISTTIASNLNALLKEDEIKSNLVQIQKSEQRLQKISEVSKEAIIFLNNGVIVEFNHTFSQVFRTQEVLHKNVREFLDLEEVQFEVLLAGTENAIIQAQGRRENDLFPVEIQSNLVDFDKSTLLVLNIRDVSQIRLVEEKLAESEEELIKAREVAKLSEIISEKNKKIISSLNYAQRIQEAVLPKQHKLTEYIPNSFLFFQSRDLVSGDFYFFRKESGRMYLAIVDCTGHGAPGAFMSLVANSMLVRIIDRYPELGPGDILKELNFRIINALNTDRNEAVDGMDVSLCVFEEKKPRQIVFSGAKRPLWRMRNNELEIFKGTKKPIGSSMKYGFEREYEEHVISLEVGDEFICFQMGLLISLIKREIN